MARRAQPVGSLAGIAALALVLAALVAAFAGIGLRVEAAAGPGPAGWQAARFTAWQALLSALASVALAVPVARALARRRLPGRALLVTLLGAPFILPVLVAVLGLLAVFGRNGWLNAALGALGLPEVSIYGAHGVVLAHVFLNMPLATRLILQGWLSVPAERFRVAAQLGLTPRAMFLAVEWPILRQVAPGAFALVLAICLTSFAVALTLGGGPRATTIELEIYQALRFDFDPGRAAALSLLQLAVAGLAAALALWFLPPAAPQGGRDLPPRRWDAPAPWGDALWIAMAAGFLLLPLLSVALSGLAGLPRMPFSVLAATWATIRVACASTAAVIVLALPIAAWLARSRRGGAEALLLPGLVASPLVIGTGWFVLVHPHASPAALALPATALANAMTALPLAVRVLLPPMRQALRDHGRLSMGLGLRGAALWRLVLVPRLRPQIGFAAGLAAALSAGDLGVVALFADPGAATLPLQMYRLMGAYRTEAAAGAALVLLATAFAMFWILDAWGRRHAAG